MSEVTERVSQGAGKREKPTRGWRALKWLGLSLAALVGMAQIGAIVQEAIPTGALSVTTLYAPGQVFSSPSQTSDALRQWAAVSHQSGPLALWLYLHLAFDGLFIIGYGALGFTTLPKTEKFARFILWALIAADVVEDLLAALAFTRVANDEPPVTALTLPLHFATIGKWALTLTLLIRLVFWAWDHARAAIGRTLLALWEQRFSVIIVAFLAILATGRGLDVLEQMPDVERSWLTAPGFAWLPAGIAVAAQLLLAVLLLFLGRMRTWRAIEKARDEDNREKPSYRPWFVLPGALFGLAMLLRWAGVTEIDGGRLGIAVGAPVAIAVASKLLEHYGWVDIDLADAAGQHGNADVRGKAARTAGDALAVAAVALTGLGLVRSFTALAILGYGGPDVTVASRVAVVLGIAIAIWIWPLANRPVRNGLRGLAGHSGLIPRFADWARKGKMGRGHPWWPWLAAGAPFLIAAGLLLIAPLRTTHVLGVLGTTVIAAGTLALLLALLAYLAQTRKPLPLFRVLRLNVTPVLTLIAIIAVTGANVDSSSAAHDIRGPVAVDRPADQDSLLTSLDNWLDHASGHCTVPSAGGTANAGPPVRFRPLILAAAAGGGIRAAWWTEHALADVVDTPCGRSDVFAVSSVSGGSLGMAVLDSAPSTQAAGTAMAAIAGPDALAAGIDGLLLHDMIDGFTGLDLAAWPMPGGQRFSDRAGLIETVWQRQDTRLAQAFPLRQPGLPWRLLFNTTDANSGCRAIIADRPLTATSGALEPDHNLTCDLSSSDPGSDSFDFFATLPCTQNIAMVTAAMLSARFSYITPSGVVPSCNHQNVLAGQFVDGGYVDSSGLLTLAELIPSLTAEVRASNARAVAQASPGQPVTLVVPIVMYLGNRPQPDPVSTPTSRIQESAVPPDARSAASAQLSTSDTLLQRIQGMLELNQWLQCDPAAEECGVAASAATYGHPYQLIFVSPRTEPRVSAPLGWVLSAASEDALTAALSEEEKPTSRCSSIPTPHACQPGVGRMADLIQFIQSG